MTTFVNPNITKIATLVNNRSGWGYVFSEARRGQTRLEDGTYGPVTTEEVITKAFGARFTDLGAAMAALRKTAKHVDEIRLSAPKPVWDKLDTKPGWKVGDTQERQHHINDVPVYRLPAGTINRQELDAGTSPLACAWNISNLCYEREVIEGNRTVLGEQNTVIRWDVLAPRVDDMIARRLARLFADNALAVEVLG